MYGAAMNGRENVDSLSWMEFILAFKSVMQEKLGAAKIFGGHVFFGEVAYLCITMHLVGLSRVWQPS